jgi:hypothetical protein
LAGERSIARPDPGTTERNVGMEWVWALAPGG